MKISINEYCKLCGVTRTTIYNRINKGLIKPIKARGTLFIDTEAYPPQQRGIAGRPLIKRLND
jgi:predicted DNA-binding transcriptional regulator AlpA